MATSTANGRRIFTPRSPFHATAKTTPRCGSLPKSATVTVMRAPRRLGDRPKRRRAALCDHHRIDNEPLESVVPDAVRDRFEDGGAAQHARLGRVDADVGEHGLELVLDEGRRNLMDGGNTRGVLRGQRYDRAHSVAAGHGKGLQIGLDPGSSAGIGARNRQTARYHFPPFAGMTRIRFDGCVLSLCEEAPRFTESIESLSRAAASEGRGARSGPPEAHRPAVGASAP